MPLAIPTLKRKPEEEDDILSKRRNEAMLHMARLAYERMKRIDKEDHERGLKEQQYNNSVKYQRMVEYELNNPGETATGVLEYEAIFKRSRGRRVKRRLMREAVENGDMKHIPRSLRPKKRIRRKPDPSKIVYNRFTPSVQRSEIERELKSKSTLTDLFLRVMPRSKSGGKKAPVVERGRELERDHESVYHQERSFEDDYEDFGYPEFRDYGLADARFNSFPRMQGVPAHIRPSIYDAYEEYGGYGTSAAFGRPPYAYGYPGGHSSVSYGGGVRYDERRRFSVPDPHHDPYPGFQPRYREATSLPDIRTHVPVEDQIDELLEEVERTSLTDSNGSGWLNDVSEEVEYQLAERKAEKRRADETEVTATVAECVALEDLPAVIQTIAISREDARLEFEDEIGYETPEIEDMVPMLVDLFDLAQLLAQESS